MEPIEGGVHLGEGLGRRAGNAVPGRELASERLGALQLGGGGRRPEAGHTGQGQVVSDPGHEGRFRAHHHQIHVIAYAVLDNRQVRVHVDLDVGLPRPRVTRGHVARRPPSATR